MSKIKITHKNRQTIIKIKLMKPEQVNPYEAEVFKTRRLPGFIRPQIINEKQICYQVLGISLEKYLERTWTSEDVIRIFFKMNEIIKSVEQYGFRIGNLVLKAKYIFIHEKTKELSLIYQPVLNSIQQENLFSFFEELLSSIILQSEETSSVHELSNCIFKMKYYSTLEMEKVLFRISPNLFPINTPKTSEYSQRLYYTMKDCQKTQYEQEEKNDLFGKVTEQETGLLFYPLENMETSLLEEIRQEQKVAYIIRRITNEKYKIRIPLFRMGKEGEGVDYRIQNNPAISRHHADLLYENVTYYIQDQGSTNGTYLNGIRLYEKQRVQLHHGDEITLANEKFQFYFEKESDIP